MTFEIIAEDGKARVGKLKTNHGTFETPFFMPVATKAVGKSFDGKDLEAMKTPSIICNSFVLSLAPGMERFKETKGIHQFMNFHKNIFTDSGGFQMYSNKFLIMTNEKGVKFKDPINGGEVFCSPEKSMQTQLTINSDVHMCLDDMPRLGAGHSRCVESIKKTAAWAKQCKTYHDQHKDGHLLFGICQGGLHEDLRKLSAEKITAIDFDGIALGGLALGEGTQSMLKAIDVTLPFLPKEKPRYLMGIGVPTEIITTIGRGMDVWDSIYPTMNARHDHLFTMQGTLEINNKKYASDFSPIEEECDCYTCKNFTRSYLHHLSRMKEAQSDRLNSLHNLRFMHRLTEQARTAIKEQRFAKFEKTFVHGYKKKVV